MTGGGQVDYYAVLGVPRNASAPDIRRAYRHVARRHHPDLNRDPRGPERFAAAARAYEVLSDPAARARYDERFLPHPVAVRRSPSPSQRRPSPPAGGLRGVLELTGPEAAYVARFPLTLTDGSGGRIVVPAGICDGDELLLREGRRLIVLQVRLTAKP
ncbi:MAG: DnaJ domain-containing protein [Solirubrobacteraceae bacterium]